MEPMHDSGAIRAERPDSVWSELDQLAGRLDELAATHDRLIQRVAGVTRGASEGETASLAVARSSAMSPVAERIRDAAERVGAMTYQLAELTDRLDL